MKRLYLGNYGKLIMRLIRTVVIAILLFSPRCIVASGIDNIYEDSLSSELPAQVSDLRLDVRPAYVFSSFKDDVLQKIEESENISESHFATSVNLQYGITFSQATEVGKLYPNVRQGIGIGTTLFDHLGSTGVPVYLYLCQGAPCYRVSDRVSFDYEWNFGISGGWKKYDGKLFRSNIIVGSFCNAYINLCFGLSYKINNQFSFYTGLDLTHFSNGNTSFPNPGVNLLGIRLGICHSLGNSVKGTPFLSDSTYRRKHVSVDMTLYGAWRRRVYRGGEEPVLLKGRYAVAGMNISPMWDIKRYFRAGLSADLQWDQSTDLKNHYYEGSQTDDIRFFRPPVMSQICGGVSCRAELVMPFFSVNLGMGYNLFGPVETRATYQLANLKIYATPSLFINIGYQLLNFQRQNNLMLGVGYTFRPIRDKCSTLSGL